MCAFFKQHGMKPRDRFTRAKAWVYVLECADGSLYTGWTSDLARRLAAHRAGQGAKYTRGRGPLLLRAFAILPSRSLAMTFEAGFKRFDRRAKWRALSLSKVLGRRFYKPPVLDVDLEGTQMPTLQAPTDQEVTTRVEEARTQLVAIETDKGTIKVKLYPDDAPIHVAAFLNLVHQGFYDGLTFHRVEPGFVVQGGCPDGDGTGGPGYRIPAEFNSKKHVLGTLAMARSSDPNSAGSQFYLCLAAASFLDGQYTVFGDTVEGVEILGKIKRGDKMNKLSVIPNPAA